MLVLFYMTNKIIHTIILTAAIIIAFMISASYRYEIFFIGAVISLYWLIKTTLLAHPPHHRLLDASVGAILIVNLILLTGGINSPVFFLTYFLLFALGLLLEPMASFIATVVLIIGFLLQLPDGQTLTSLLPLVSLALMTPFALILGQEYQKTLAQKRDIIILTKKNQALRQKLLQLIRDHEKS